MIYRWRRHSCLLIIAVLVLVGGCAKKSKDSIRIATSANMEPALHELVNLFAETSDTEVELIVASSGQLAAQIDQGAPFDLFVAANKKYPNSLWVKGACEAPITYGYGSLALWSMTKKSVTLEDLLDEDVKKVAIPNPELAPYGAAAVEFLKANGLYAKIEHKLVYGESVAQVNTFVKSEVVSIGFTSLSSVVAQAKDEAGAWLSLDVQDYSLIQQDLCVLNESDQSAKVQEFLGFMLSGKGRSVLEKYGYLVPEE
jgi:molybdate transport system substrate-binding protein